MELPIRLKALHINQACLVIQDVQVVVEEILVLHPVVVVLLVQDNLFFIHLLHIA